MGLYCSVRVQYMRGIIERGMLRGMRRLFERKNADNEEQ